MRFLAQHKTAAARAAALGVLILLHAAPLAATTPTTGPWVDAVTTLQTAFTGTIARGLSLVAIVIGGLMFAFGEGGSKRALAGIIFGLGMTLGAANFIDWLF
ncbi:MAG: TrbC/VirB2 family protein [Bryobacterales bacterium]|nr:TrbC/VirB2 family protein [Bryobacterales bacterium]MDE0296132.1 TrbC/VirB2 family protein [Bryobacterales bacterium]